MKKTILMLLLLAVLSVSSLAETAELRFDHDLFSIGYQGLYMDEAYGYFLQFSMTNNSLENIMVSIDFLSVDGILAQPYFADMIAPGESGTERVVIDALSAMLTGRIPTQIVVDLWVYSADDSSQRDLYHDQVAFYPEGREQVSLYVRENRPGDIPLIEEDGFAVTLYGASRKNGTDLSLSLYLENRTDQNLMVRVLSAEVNGVAFSPFYSQRLIGECAAFGTLDIMDALGEMFNVPGSNQVVLSMEVLERSGKDSKVLWQQEVPLKL